MNASDSLARALLDPEAVLPPGLVAANPHERFGIYRNNVVAGLVDALANGFPAVAAIVGTEFFRAMAAAYVRAAPPCSPVLLQYGETLGDFIDAFPPAADLPYLGDVARLEAAYTRVFHAADALPLAPAALAVLDPARLDTIRLQLHPALAILRSAYPVVTLWGMNAGSLALGPIDDWAPQDALVLRPDLDTGVMRLPPGRAAFLEALLSQATIATAAAAGFAAAADFNLAAALAATFTDGLAIAILTSPEDLP